MLRQTIKCVNNFGKLDVSTKEIESSSVKLIKL